MNAITKTLLAGAAFGALATAPALAGDVPPFHVMALHAGHVVGKTRIHHAGRTHVTSTLEVSTSIPASDLDKKIKLLALVSVDTNCSGQLNFKITKKATYGKVGFYSETFSGGCGNGGYTEYGNTYKLTNPEGEGKNDSFVSSLIDKVEYKGVKYKVTVNADFNVAIGD
jgi:hypothetical protein